MQTKTLLALFCTIFIVFVGVNDGAPTSKTTTTTKATTTTKPTTTVKTTTVKGVTPVVTEAR